MTGIRVLFDHQAFSEQRYGGISNSFVQLIANMPNDIKVKLGLRYTENYHLLNGNIGFKNTWTSNDKHKFGYQFLEKHCAAFFHTPNNMTYGYSKKLMAQGNYDILHATYFDPYFLQYNTKPFIITIHDMIPEIYNFEEKQITGKKELAEKASHIITVSECTKRDLMRILKIPKEKITVIYHGFESREISRKPSPIDSPYILYVGARWCYKGFYYFISQVASFLEKHPEFYIICTGGAFTEDEIQTLKHYNIFERTKHKFCTTDELNQLYSHAFAFVFPSEYEGFGMPILEAFHAGCPVLLNDKSCFQEVAQDAALYFDSDSSSNTLLSQLHRLYDMPERERQDLLLRAKERLSFFSWEKSAAKLAEVYRKVLQYTC